MPRRGLLGPLQGIDTLFKADLECEQLSRVMRERLEIHGLDLPKYGERGKVEEGRMEVKKDIATQRALMAWHWATFGDDEVGAATAGVVFGRVR